MLLGVVSSATALRYGGPSPKPDKVAHATLVAETTQTSSYSGGHLLAADPSGGTGPSTRGWGHVVRWRASVWVSGAFGTEVSKPIVGMAATPDGQGYWLVGQ